MSLGVQTPRDQLDRLLALIRRSFRYWYVAAIAAVVGAGLTIVFAMLRPHKYESSSVIMYQEVISARLLQGSGAVSSRPQSMALRFREMVMARPLLEKVVTKEKLMPELVEDEGMGAAIEIMRTRVGFHIGGGGTFVVSYTGESPDEVKVVTARIADELIEWEKDLLINRTGKTREFLDRQRQQVEDRLRTSERTLAEFLALHPEFAAETAATATAGAGIRAAQTGSKSTRTRDPGLRALERQQGRIKARLAANSNSRPAPPPTRKLTPEQRQTQEAVRSARRDLDAAKRELENRQSRFTERHPDVVSAKNKVSSATRRLSQAESAAALALGTPIAKTKPPSQAEREALEVELKDVNRQLASYRRRMASAKHKSAKTASPKRDKGVDRVVLLETDHQRLRREVTELRERYDSIESKAFTAEMVAASELATQGSQLTVIEPAFRPTKPAGTPRTILVMAGLVAFTGIGIVLAFGFALIDDRIVSKYDVERLEILPVLAVVPASSRASKKKLKKSERDAFGDAGG